MYHILYLGLQSDENQSCWWYSGIGMPPVDLHSNIGQAFLRVSTQKGIIVEFTFCNRIILMRRSHPVTVKGKSVVRIQSSLLFQLPYHIGHCHHNFIVQITMEMFYLCQGWGHKWEMHPLLITAIAWGRAPLIFPQSLLMIIKSDSHTSPSHNPAILWCLQRFATPMCCESSVHLKLVLLAIHKNWNRLV